MFFAVVALLLTTPLVNAQESTVNQKSEYLQRDDLGADYNTAIEKLHEAANKLNELESALSVSLANTEGKVDKLRPASCEFIDQKLSWDGTQWVCSDDVNEELEWFAKSGWSGCSTSCGGGVRTRSIGCRMKIQGTEVGSQYCTNLATNSQPSSSQSCNTHACYTGTWATGAWGTCSASCGGGTQTRSVTCLASSICSGTKPATSQSCNIQACPTSGAWSTGSWSAWGSCSKTCGSGTQTRSRSVSCSYDSCTGSKPVSTETQVCNTQACAPTSGKWVRVESCNTTAKCIQKYSTSGYAREGSSCTPVGSYGARVVMSGLTTYDHIFRCQ